MRSAAHRNAPAFPALSFTLFVFAATVGPSCKSESEQRFEARLEKVAAAQAAAQAGRGDEALRLFDEALAIEAADAGARRGKAEILAERGDPLGAAKVLWPCRSDSLCRDKLRAVAESLAGRERDMPADNAAGIAAIEDVLGAMSGSTDVLACALMGLLDRAAATPNPDKAPLWPVVERNIDKLKPTAEAGAAGDPRVPRQEGWPLSEASGRAAAETRACAQTVNTLDSLQGRLLAMVGTALKPGTDAANGQFHRMPWRSSLAGRTEMRARAFYFGLLDERMNGLRHRATWQDLTTPAPNTRAQFTAALDRGRTAGLDVTCMLFDLVAHHHAVKSPAEKRQIEKWLKIQVDALGTLPTPPRGESAETAKLNLSVDKLAGRVQSCAEMVLVRRQITEMDATRDLAPGTLAGGGFLARLPAAFVTTLRARLQNQPLPDDAPEHAD